MKRQQLPHYINDGDLLVKIVAKGAPPKKIGPGAVRLIRAGFLAEDGAPTDKSREAAVAWTRWRSICPFKGKPRSLPQQ